MSKEKVPCKGKLIMSLKDCKPCFKKSKCRKYLTVLYFSGKYPEKLGIKE